MATNTLGIEPRKAAPPEFALKPQTNNEMPPEFALKPQPSKATASSSSAASADDQKIKFNNMDDQRENTALPYNISYIPKEQSNRHPVHPETVVNSI